MQVKWLFFFFCIFLYILDGAQSCKLKNIVETGVLVKSLVSNFLYILIYNLSLIAEQNFLQKNMVKYGINYS